MAWPYGECDGRLEDIAEECGYRASWSVWKGTNSRHSLWRVPLGRRDNLPRFIAKVSGAYFPTKFLEQQLERFRGSSQQYRRKLIASFWSAAPQKSMKIYSTTTLARFSGADTCS